MKNLTKKILYFCLLVSLMMAMPSCLDDGGAKVRVTLEELKTGAFYGGSLMFAPYEPSFSHLGEGTLIAFQDITYGWKDTGEPTVLGKKYGYVYIQEASRHGLTYEYLIYGPDGRILEEDISVFHPVIEGEASFASFGDGNGFSGISYHTDFQTGHPVLEETFLLTFQHEIPDQEGAPTTLEETYRRVVFRIQQPGTTQDSPFPKGVISISHSGGKSLVVNSSFHTQANPEDIVNETGEIAFLRTEILPDFAEGDFIFDTEKGYLRQVEWVDNSHVDYTILGTVSASIEDALGTVVLDLEGDLSEIIQKYGSPEDKANFQNIRRNLINKEWPIDIINQQQVRVTLKNDFALDFDVSLHLHTSWNEFNSIGELVFPMKFSSILEIYAKLGFEEGDTKKLAEPGIHFNVSGIPVHVSVPIYLYYDLKAVLESIDLQFGPKLYLDVGFKYDIGAKVKLGNVYDWSSASGIFSHSEKIIKHIDYEGSPEIISDVGFKLYPGVTIACILRPQMETPAYLQGDLKSHRLSLDLVTKGYMEIELDVKFYKHTFNFGKVFQYDKNIYKHDLN